MSICFISRKDTQGHPQLPTAWGPFDSDVIDIIMDQFTITGEYDVYTDGRLSHTFEVSPPNRSIKKVS